MQPDQQPAPQTPAAPGVAPGAFPATPSQAAAPAPKNPNSSQNSLLISEIRDSMVIMNDGSFRAVMSCESINFDLMSEREREGVEYSYQKFLNSLYFSIQIFVRSQRVDIGPYIDRLVKIRRDQDNMLLGVLMDDYVNFIDALSQEANIMDKSFYVIVSYAPTGDVSSAVNASRNLFTNLFAGNKRANITIDKATYDKAKEEISNRVNAVLSGLFQMGVRGAQLNTQQLAALYYNMYNPDTAVRQPIGSFESITGTYVQKGDGAASQPQLERTQD